MLNVEFNQSSAMMKLCLTRPEKGNSLNAELVERLLSEMGDLSFKSARTLVFQAEGKSFCTGFDLSGLRHQTDASLLHRFIRVEILLQTIYHLPIRTIGIAKGNTFGAGADLFCACQDRWALPDTRFSFPGAQFGIKLGTGRLAKRIGPEMATQVVTGAKVLDAQRALELGLVTRIVSSDEIAECMTDDTDTNRSVSAETEQSIRDIVTVDTRYRDMYELVMSASRPGLKERIVSYIARIGRTA